MDPRLAPGRDQQLLAAELRAVLEGERVALPAPLRRARLHPEPQLDSLRGRASASASPRAGASFGSRRSSPSAIATDAHQARERLAELDADGPAAEDDQALRDLGQRRGLTVGPDVVELVKPVDRRDHGVRAGGDDQPLGLEQLPVDLDLTRLVDAGVAPAELDAGLGQLARRVGVVPVGDLEVPPGQRLLDVDRAGDRLAGAGRLPRLGEDLARSQHRLRGDAGPVAAFARRPARARRWRPSSPRPRGPRRRPHRRRRRRSRSRRSARHVRPKSPNGSSRSRTASLKPASAARRWKAKPSGVCRAMPSKKTPSYCVACSPCA